MQSIVRLYDTLTVEPAPEGAVGVVPITALIVLKADQAEGDYELRIRCNYPSGKSTLIGESRMIKFHGKERGTVIHLNISHGVEEFGLYWFDVLIDGEIVSRMPLRLQPQPVGSEPK